MNPLPMVIADLRAMRGAALLSILLIALAVAIGVAIGAQERALRSASARAADDFPLLIGAPASATQLVLTSVYLQPEALTLMDGALLPKLASDPRVEAVAPIAFGDVVLGYPVVGTTAEFVTRWGRRQLVEGRNFAAEGEAVVGAEVKLAIGQSITPSHGVAGQHRHFGLEDEEEHAHRHEGVRYTVVGRLPHLGSPWDRAILIPVESVWETHGLGNGHRDESHIGAPFEAEHLPGVPALVVKPKQVFQAYQLRSDTRKAGLLAVFPAEILVSLYQTVGDIRDVLVVASGLNNVLVFLAILMLLVTLVSLRRRRYAILRALGASRTYVALVVWLGAAVLLSLGAFAGLAAGFIGAHAVAMLVAAETGLTLTISIGAGEVALVGLMALFGSLLALIPAAIAWRRPVAESLRS
ncbi:MAG: ABC transporter permease [Ancalomicrobiaceae bacterium]|nr:ABC transporter permease [Ancalomicrobiaceae bacterium]